ncbi:DinB family protein [Cohnella zeiphila]|uniref:Damage-inducible protein DinB n=1 Tax=Cohnella zeiphila TaxID=2761120 RepID=A0A7X0SHP8_9BACL|nr:DinB family protein [Cohnella zeiphila]MBB6730142.1 damage-inducible protein DinB [Cohnella zeiphila]
MNFSERLIGELKREAESTRRVLERVPSDKLSWKPHKKSMSLGQLALHTAGVPGALAELLDERSREVPVVPLPEATSVSEILSALDKYMLLAENKLLAWGETGLMESWKLTREGIAILEVPRIEMVRTLMLNHWYHHRGQLTVYLRLLEVPVPSIYGPSADESSNQSGRA